MNNLAEDEISDDISDSVMKSMFFLPKHNSVGRCASSGPSGFFHPFTSKSSKVTSESHLDAVRPRYGLAHPKVVTDTIDDNHITL